MEGSGCDLLQGISWHLTEGFRKTMKNLNQDSWSLDQDLNLEPLEYKVGVLTTQPICLVMSALYSQPTLLAKI
jgi:hypothetical protein